jgi:hypothetical protein
MVITRLITATNDHVGRAAHSFDVNRMMGTYSLCATARIALDHSACGNSVSGLERSQRPKREDWSVVYYFITFNK